METAPGCFRIWWPAEDRTHAARPAPAAGAQIELQDLLEAVHGLRLEPVHGVPDHAMLTLEIAPEVHGELDVLRMIKAAHGSLVS